MRLVDIGGTIATFTEGGAIHGTPVIPTAMNRSRSISPMGLCVPTRYAEEISDPLRPRPGCWAGSGAARPLQCAQRHRLPRTAGTWACSAMIELPALLGPG